MSLNLGLLLSDIIRNLFRIRIRLRISEKSDNLGYNKEYLTDIIIMKVCM